SSKFYGCDNYFSEIIGHTYLYIVKYTYKRINIALISQYLI
ncbi:MAG: hypothetical protein RLZZ171_2924, partial [Cyanobacteriota bacterium]